MVAGRQELVVGAAGALNGAAWLAGVVGGARVPHHDLGAEEEEGGPWVPPVAGAAHQLWACVVSGLYYTLEVGRL